MKLKNCPFCCGEASLLRARGITDFWYVECTACRTRQLASNDEKEATTKWNTRTTDSASIRKMIKEGKTCEALATLQESYGKKGAEILELIMRNNYA